MSIARLNPHPTILQRALADRLWGERDFFLIDVGASGGLEKHWQLFGDRLRAIAFEPLVREAERLQQGAAGTKIHYEAAFVTCGSIDSLFPPDVRNDRMTSKSNDPFQRVSAVRAMALMRMNYIEQVFNAGAPAVYADRSVALDDYVPGQEQRYVDFVKIDTDGHDFPVLLGAEALIRSGGALGFSIEAQFHGASHDYANTFSNIDRFMRAHGFSLFDLEPYRYSRSALPARFAHDIPAQTLSGQVMWAEALYFRDLADHEYERMWPYEVTVERVVKLACLYELFGLADCAAELLVERRELIGEPATVLLDGLVPGQGTSSLSYAEFIRRFEADPQAMYPSRTRSDADFHPSTADAGAQPGQSGKMPSPANSDASELRRLRKRLDRQEQKIAELQDRVRRRNARIEQLTRPDTPQKIV
jgi:FkbM family methyltransferase